MNDNQISGGEPYITLENSASHQARNYYKSQQISTKNQRLYRLFECNNQF